MNETRERKKKSAIIPYSRIIEDIDAKKKSLNITLK